MDEQPPSGEWGNEHKGTCGGDFGRRKTRSVETGWGRTTSSAQERPFEAMRITINQLKVA